MRFPKPKSKASPDSAALPAGAAEPNCDLDHQRRLALLGTLTGSIAHEFNNILTPVRAYAEMAKAAPDDRELVTRTLDRVIAGVERAGRISEAILALASTGSHSPARATADVLESIESAVLCLARDPARDGIRVSIQAPRNLNATIEPAALQQVLLNLVLNARAAMRSHGGCLTIRARSTGNTPGPTVVIEVEDSGCGIPPGFVPRVFDPFFSAEPPVPVPGSLDRSGRDRRHGLGLAICKQLIDKAGGSIGLRSTVGVGTCFTIHLPTTGAQIQSQAA